MVGTTLNNTPIFNSSLTVNQQPPLAQVRQGSGLSPQEITALQARSTHTHAALQNFLGTDFDAAHTPQIGLACSGGSSRAAIATLGLLRALEKIGLLDGVTHAAGVSGSTWTLSSWLYNNMPLDELTTILKHRIGNKFNVGSIDRHKLAKTLQQKKKLGRKISVNEAWGMVIGDVFLNNAQQLSLDHIRPQVMQGMLPLPLFCAILGQTSPHYQWMEFSPFEIGSTYLNAWIPANAFGKKFDAGASFDPLPGESLPYLLGLYGSAYAVTVGDLFERLPGFLDAQYGIKVDLPQLPTIFRHNNLRLSAPAIHNFAYHLDATKPLHQQNHLTVIDAGIDCDLPFPPLLRRNIDIYIVCDASKSVFSVKKNHMHKVEAYTQQENYPLPAIDYHRLTKQKVSIIHDENKPDAPVIIYVPNLNNFPTTKLQYKPAEFDKILLDIENAVVENKEAIRTAVAFAVKRRALK